MAADPIGKVSLKVYPDTSHFGEETRKQANRETKRIWVELPVRPDMAYFKTKLLADVRALNKYIKGNSAYEIKVPASVDIKGMDKLIKEWAEKAKKDVEKEPLVKPVHVDVDKKSTKDALEEIEDTLGDTHKIDVSPIVDKHDLTDVYDALENTHKIDIKPIVDKGALNDVYDALENTHKIKILSQDDIDTAVLDLSKTWEAETQKLPKIKPDLDDDAFKKNLTRLGKRTREWSKNANFKIEPEVGFAKLKSTFSKFFSKISEQAKARAIEFKAAFDPASIKADIKEFTASTKAKIKAKLDAADAKRELILLRREMDKETFKINPELNKPGLARVVRALDTFKIKLERIGITKIRTAVDKISLAKTKAAIVERFKGMKADVKMVLGDTKKVIAEAQAAKRIIKQSLGDVKMNIKAAVDKKSFAGATEAIRRLSGQRIHWDLIKPGFDTAKNFDKVSVKASAAMTAIGGLTSVLMHASGVILGVAGDLGKMSAAALVAPGAILAAAASAHVFTSAMKDFNAQVPQAKAGMEQLSKVASGSFWSQARAPMREMVNTFLPKMTVGYRKLGAAMGSWTGKLASAMKQFMAPQLDSFFTSLSTAVKNSGGLATNIGKAGGSFMAIATHYMPRIGQAMTDVSNKLAAWLDNAVKSGEAFKWIDEAVVQMKHLGSVAVSAVRIVGGLSKAANDAGFGLAGLDKGMQAVARTVNSDVFKKNMTAVFKSARTAMSNLGREVRDYLGPAFINLGATLQTVLPHAATAAGLALGGLLKGIASDEFREGFSSMSASVENGFKTMKPHLANMVKALGVLGKAAGKVFENFAPLIGRALDASLPILKAAGQALDDLTLNLGTGMTAIVDATQPLITKAVPALSSFAATLSSSIGAGLEKIAPHVANLSTAIGDLFVKILPSGSPVLRMLTEDFADLAASGIQWLADAIVRATPTIEKIFNFLRDNPGIVKTIAEFALLALSVRKLTPLFNGLHGAFKALSGTFNAVKGGLQGMTKLFSKLGKGGKTAEAAEEAGKLTGKLKAIRLIKFGGVAAGIIAIGAALVYAYNHSTGFKNFVDTTLQTFKSSLKEIGDGLKKNLIDNFNKLKPKFQELGKSITDLFNSISGAFGKDGAKDITEVFQMLIRFSGSSALATLETAFDLLGNAIGLVVDALKTLTDSLKFFVDLFRAFSGSGDWTTVWDDLKTVFGDLGTLLLDAGKTLADAAIDVAKQAVAGFSKGWSDKLSEAKTAVDNWFQSIIDWVKDKLGIHSPSTVFQSMGWDVVAGFINGIGDKIGEAVTKIGEWFGSVVTTAWTWIKQKWTEGLNSLSALTSSIGAGIKSAWQAVTNWLSTKASQVWTAIKGFFSSGLNNAKSLVSSIGNTIKSLWTSMTNSLKSLASSAWNSVKGAFNSGRAAVSSAVSNAKASIINHWNAMKNSLVSTARNAWAQAKSAFSGGISNVVSLARGLPGRVKSALGNLGRTLWHAGRSLIQGFIDGISSMLHGVSSIVSRVTSAASGISSRRLMTTMTVDAAPALKTMSAMRTVSPLRTMSAMRMVSPLSRSVEPLTTETRTFSVKKASPLAAPVTSFVDAVKSNTNALTRSTVEKTSAEADGKNGIEVNVTNHYPQAEPTSRTVNRALQLAALMS